MASSLPVPILVVLAAVLAAAVIDWWKFKIHNLLTLPLLLSGLTYHYCLGEWSGLLNSVSGLLFGFSVMFFFFVLGGMGGGDVKLVAAIGAWLGLELTFCVFLATSLAAGVYALAVVLLVGNVRETWINLQILWHRIARAGRHLGAEDRIEHEVARPDRRRRLIPFAAMVAAGILALVVWARLVGAL